MSFTGSSKQHLFVIIYFDRRCRGGHEVSQFHCSESCDYSCGRSCGRLLACGNHLCERGCHVVINPPSEELVSQYPSFTVPLKPGCVCTVRCRPVKIVFHVRESVRRIVKKDALMPVPSLAIPVSLLPTVSLWLPTLLCVLLFCCCRCLSQV